MFDDKSIEKMPGHWLLAKMGKKVLRPGGKELTIKLISELKITASDDIVEFAPGLGFTATLALQYHPLSYTGVDANSDAIKLLQSKIKGNNISFVQGNATRVLLQDESKDKIYVEAMLSMQADHRKVERLYVKPGVSSKKAVYTAFTN